VLFDKDVANGRSVVSANTALITSKSVNDALNLVVMLLTLSIYAALFISKTDNPFETKQAPSLRTLYDLSDLEQSLFIYQTGQSGWVQNKLYRNMSALWAQNEYLPLKMKPQKVGRQLDLLIKEK
jgi:hypothetical protein